MYPKLEIINRVKPKQHFQRYVFGSAVYSYTPMDVDIAIVYDEKYIGVKEAIVYKREIEEQLSCLFPLDIDIILLSQSEEEEMSFLKNAKYVQF